MGKNPFCYHAKLGGGKEFANCSHLVATGTEAGACVSIHCPGGGGGRAGRSRFSPRPLHLTEDEAAPRAPRSLSPEGTPERCAQSLPPRQWESDALSPHFPHRREAASWTLASPAPRSSFPGKA